MTSTYFAVEPPPADATGWSTLRALAEDPAVARAKVAGTADLLHTDDHRVAASLDFQGVAARVVSPALRAATFEQAVPVLDPDRIWWRPVQPGPMRLAWDTADQLPVSAPTFLAAVVHPVLRPVLAAYRDHFGVSAQVLWGDLASALNGAAMMLGHGEALVRDLLEVDELRGTALSAPPRFVRNSCCLYYRLPQGSTCGDCVLSVDR